MTSRRRARVAPLALSLSSLLALSLAPSAHAGHGKQMSSSGRAMGEKGEANLRALDTRFITAFNKKDLETLLTYYADDAIVMDPGPAMWARGKDEIRNGFAQFFAGIDQPRLALQESRYAIQGTLGYSAGLFILTGRDVKSGAPIEMRGRTLTVFEQRNGQWVAVADHASIPFNPPSPAPPSPAAPAKK